MSNSSAATLPRAQQIRTIRDTLARVGFLGPGGPLGSMPPNPESAFGEAKAVEGDAVTARPIVGIADVPDAVGFLEGFQRFTVEGWVGVCPVVRASVSAAALLRRGRALEPVASMADEFLVAPLDAIDSAIVSELRASGLPLLDAGASGRRHPTVDVRNAVQLVQQRRFQCELQVAQMFRDRFPTSWLIVDGGLRGYDRLSGRERLLGVIRSHETQYLAGVDLEVALTLPAEFRTTVFERHAASDASVYSWYVRLWEWKGNELLHGLVRLERPVAESVVGEADAVSRWILAERIPLAGNGRKWDRFLYPISQVASYLRAKAGGWS